jgi:hypothetical protein
LLFILVIKSFVMRKTLLFYVSFTALLFAGIVVKAQTTLALGDIAFTGYNSTSSDNFSFVILKTGGIAANTQIKFTSRGWWGMPTNTCGTNSWATTVEEEVVWTTTNAIPYGWQVAITGLTTTAVGTVTGTPLNLSSGGDQIIAYQGTQTGAHTVLAGIQMNYTVGVTNSGANNWDNTGAVSPTGTETNRPPCIVNGTHGLFVTQPAANADGMDEVDNARIKGSVILSGNPATDRSRINNRANWDVSDVSEFTLPGPLSGLPVSFTWLKANDKTGGVAIEWGIGIEEQMKDYTIEKSSDGRVYRDAGMIPASGKKTYTWTDPQPYNGINYYRIRATEISGTIKYSTIVIVNRSNGGKGIAVYPTVLDHNMFTLQVNNLPADSYKLNIYSATGQLTVSRVIIHTGGSATQTVALPPGMQKGIYRVSFIGSMKIAAATIVVQ